MHMNVSTFKIVTACRHTLTMRFKRNRYLCTKTQTKKKENKMYEYK